MIHCYIINSASYSRKVSTITICGFPFLYVAMLFLSVTSQAVQYEPRAISLPLKYQQLGAQAYVRGVSLEIGSL
jgi:hypothetical protein